MSQSTKPKRKSWPCFNCKKDTGSTVQSVKKKGMTPICMDEKCWNKFWQETWGDEANG